MNYLFQYPPVIFVILAVFIFSLSACLIQLISVVLESRMQSLLAEHIKIQEDIKELQVFTDKAIRVHGVILSELDSSFKQLGVSSDEERSFSEPVMIEQKMG